MMKKAILAKKLGMTQIFAEDGKVIPVTVLEAGPCVVVQKKTVETDGYAALQVGFGEVKPSRLTQPEKGHFAVRLGANAAPSRVLKELRLDDCDAYEVGAEIKADVFEVGDCVDVSGTSKGKGFQGPIKRHNFARGPITHGSKYHRGPGAMGAGTTPGRVRKGRKMAGHMGAAAVTVQNVEIVRTDAENNLILIKGAVPGTKGALVVVKSTVKV